MWVKLSTEYVNLDNVFRVRFSRGFRNGSEEWAAELDAVDPKGQLSVVTRVRGGDALMLQSLLAERCRQDSLQTVGTETPMPVHAMTGTVADMNLP